MTGRLRKWRFENYFSAFRQVHTAPVTPPILSALFSHIAQQMSQGGGGQRYNTEWSLIQQFWPMVKRRCSDFFFKYYIVFSSSTMWLIFDLFWRFDFHIFLFTKVQFFPIFLLKPARIFEFSNVSPCEKQPCFPRYQSINTLPVVPGVKEIYLFLRNYDCFFCYCPDANCIADIPPGGQKTNEIFLFKQYFFSKPWVEQLGPKCNLTL